jgi:hypothetical protein
MISDEQVPTANNSSPLPATCNPLQAVLTREAKAKKSKKRPSAHGNLQDAL